MKRCAELLQLSREHYHALKLALDAKKAAAGSDAAAMAQQAAAILTAAAAELEPHFQLEESRLLPAMAAAGCADLVARTLDEHRQLREAVAALAQPSSQVLQRFSELLQAHVRFEERELFEAAQAQLDAATLAALIDPRPGD